MRPSARAVLAVAALAVVAAACGGGDDGPANEEAIVDDETSNSSAADGTATTLSPEEEVLTAYEAASDALSSAYDPPDPDHPDLLATYGGEALSRIQGTLSQLQGEGVSYVGTFELHPTVITLAGNTAVIEDCYVNHTQVVQTETREPIGEPGEAVLHVEVHLERSDGTWRLVEKQELSEPCTPD